MGSKRLNIWQIAIVTSALAGSLLALLSARQTVEKLLAARHQVLRTWYGIDVFDVIALASILLIIVSILLFVLAILGRMATFRMLVKEEYITCRRCTEKDLDTVLQLAFEAFGDRVTKREEINQLFRYTPGSFWLVEGSKPYGYFILFSLTPAGEQAIVDGYYHGPNPAREHINREMKLSDAICIGAIVGIGFRGKAAALGAMTAKIDNSHINRVYGKAVSNSGLRLVRQFNFVRVDGGDSYEIDRYYCSQPPGLTPTALDEGAAIPAEPAPPGQDLH